MTGRREATVLLRRGQIWKSAAGTVEIIESRPIADVSPWVVRWTRPGSEPVNTAVPPEYIVDKFALCTNEPLRGTA